jgi:POT family proton-dependent oligopeptide transporter
MSAASSRRWLRHRRRAVRLALGLHARGHRHGERPADLYLRQPLSAAEPPRVAPVQPVVRQQWYEASMAQRFALLAGISGVVIVFRGAYEQIGNTLPLWIEHVDRSIGSFQIPMTWFQSLNPLLVFTLTPWFVARWVRHAREGHELTSIRKMAIGAGGVALSYLLLAAVAMFSNGGVVAEGWIWLASSSW